MESIKETRDRKSSEDHDLMCKGTCVSKEFQQQFVSHKN